MDPNRVFFFLANQKFLVELSSKNAAKSLIEDVFDVDDVHVICHPRMVMLQMLVSWVLDRRLKIVKSKRHYQISVRLRVQLLD